MNTTAVLAALVVAAFGLLGAAKLAAVPAMRARAEHVGFSVAAYRRIGALEILGAGGVLLGGAVPAVGILAGIGLVLLLGGAVATHLRNGEGLGEIAPAVVLGAVACGYVVLLAGQLS
jgi:hypothetical protein